MRIHSDTIVTLRNDLSIIKPGQLHELIVSVGTPIRLDNTPPNNSGTSSTLTCALEVNESEDIIDATIASIQEILYLIHCHPNVGYVRMIRQFKEGELIGAIFYARARGTFFEVLLNFIKSGWREAWS